MPSRARLDEFIAVVESGDHAGAIERYYTEDATMQENAALPRAGRDTLVAHERAALARMSHVDSKCVSSVVEGDRVALHWNFMLTENPAWCAASTRSPGRNGAAKRFSANVSFTTRPRSLGPLADANC
jgi:predicted SnoaL-like aldol condensation-catalyzing enzyme